MVHGVGVSIYQRHTVQIRQLLLWEAFGYRLFLGRTGVRARLNIRMLPYEYNDSHYKDKMVSRPPYLYDGYSHRWIDGLCIETGPENLLQYFRKRSIVTQNSFAADMSRILIQIVHYTLRWKHFPHHCPFVPGIHRPRWIPRTKASDAELCCFDVRLNKRVSKQSWGWWFETPPCSLWRHCNDLSTLRNILHRRSR